MLPQKLCHVHCFWIRQIHRIDQCRDGSKPVELQWTSSWCGDEDDFCILHNVPSPIKCKSQRDFTIYISQGVGRRIFLLSTCSDRMFLIGCCFGCGCFSQDSDILCIYSFNHVLYAGRSSSWAVLHTAKPSWSTPDISRSKGCMLVCRKVGL